MLSFLANPNFIFYNKVFQEKLDSLNLETEEIKTELDELSNIVDEANALLETI